MKGRHIASTLAFGISLFGAREAAAFCGFYVSGADTKLFNDATQVALMRDGTRTVLSMQNDYKGPPEDFALVVPVPVILQKENVKTLPKDVFDRLDKLTSPRLVEYWEQDPCAIGLGAIGTLGHGAGTGTGQGFGSGGGRLGGDLGVKIEAQFAVGEYEILILSAKDSSGLDTWLRENNYKIPAGAADVLKPYVEGGSKFFVAKVDVKKVTMENGRAALSPLRFHYDSEKLELPVKLGLLNSSGTQDLIVYVLGKDRYEVANFPNVTIPTNLDVSEQARGSFGPFYASLYDHTVQKNPGAVVTEYSWQATSCDPCPGNVSGLLGPDIAALGADATPTLSNGRTGAPSLRQGETKVTGGKLAPEVVQRIVRQSFGRFRMCYESGLKNNPNLQGRVTIKFDIGPDGKASNAEDGGSDFAEKGVIDCVARGFGNLTFPEPEDKKRVSVSYPIHFAIGAPVLNAPLVVTRMHARYGKGALGADLVFRVADPIIGGREVMTDGKLETGAKPTTGMSSFQARYAIRHPWTGPITCKEPQRGIWGGPWPDAGAQPQTATATKLGLEAHGGASLASFTSVTGAELDGTKLLAKPGADDAGVPVAANAGAATPKPAPSSKCGCRAIGAETAGEENAFGVLLLGMLAATSRRRARRSPPA